MSKPQSRKHRSERSAALAALEPVVVYPLPRRFRRGEDTYQETRPGLRFSFLMKRWFDILTSLFLLILLSPLFLLLSIAIVMDSKGHVFYSDRRVGLHGRTFRLFKFRTMHRDAHLHRVRLIQENVSRKMLFKHKRDPRVTRLGKWLRKTSLDELPQLWNVLRGDMSIIGPRPYLLEDFEAVESEESALYWHWSRERHRLWPGLTGLWQVSGRNDLSFQQSMELDLHYVNHWSFRQELRILLKTLPAVFACRGAY